jgi:CBS domain containing-hemolysin-like protein
MTPRTDIIAIEINDDLTTVLEAIRDKGYSRIPVYEGTIDHIIGLIYAKDLLTEIGRDPGAFTLRDKLRPAYYVPETKLLRNLLHEFQTQKLHIAVVLDEYGGTAGIVTIEDILEELVGEIADEYEQTPTEMFRKIDEQTFEVDARMYIDDANSELDIELPDEEDYDTLGGFVFSHLGYIPKVGDRFDYGPLTISVTAAGPRAVKRLRIKKKPVENKPTDPS